jgi:PAP2 superfamily
MAHPVPGTYTQCMSVLDVVGARARTWRDLMMPEVPTRFSRFVGVLIAVSVALLNAVMVVQAINLYHAIAIGTPLDKGIAMLHGQQIFALEQRLHIAVEPVVQPILSSGIWTPLGVLPGAVLRSCAVWIYLNALPAWLLAALAWSYLYRPRHFVVLRDLTIISALLSVACYRFFPTAPPRFVLHGAPYHLQDWTYGGTSINTGVVQAIGFNPYAAFPSVHLLWALIPALCLASGSRHLWVWAASFCYPVVMVVTVISSGNHYVLDCVGSLAILAIGYLLARGLNGVRRWMWPEGRQVKYELPAALGLCMGCAGILATTSATRGVRALIALAILVLIAIATRRSAYLWRGRRRLRSGRQPLVRTDYLAGLLLVAGSSAAAHEAGHLAHAGVRVCALLWLLACMSALARHMFPKQARPASRHGIGPLRRLALPRRRPAQTNEQRVA